jgi:hypothetical protein
MAISSRPNIWSGGLSPTNSWPVCGCVKRAESVIRAAIYSWKTDTHHLCQLDQELGAGRLETGTKVLGPMRTYSRAGMLSAISVRLRRRTGGCIDSGSVARCRAATERASFPVRGATGLGVETSACRVARERDSRRLPQRIRQTRVGCRSAVWLRRDCYTQGQGFLAAIKTKASQSTQGGTLYACRVFAGARPAIAELGAADGRHQSIPPPDA